MKHAWTKQERDTLEKRWRAGDTSSAIAADMPGVTRHAVMGMVNRLGLMGAQNTGRPALEDGPEDEDDLHSERGLELWCEAWNDARKAAAHMGYAERYDEDGETVSHLLDLDQEMAFIIMAARSGRNPTIMRSVCGPGGGGDDRIDDMLRRLDGAGVWPDGTPLPERWRSPETAGPAVVLDAMAIAGWLEVSNDREGVSYRIVPGDPSGCP